MYPNLTQVVNGAIITEGGVSSYLANVKDRENNLITNNKIRRETKLNQT